MYFLLYFLKSDKGSDHYPRPRTWSSTPKQVFKPIILYRLCSDFIQMLRQWIPATHWWEVPLVETVSVWGEGFVFKRLRDVPFVTCGAHCALLKFTPFFMIFYFFKSRKTFVFCPDCVEEHCLSLNSSEWTETTDNLPIIPSLFLAAGKRAPIMLFYFISLFSVSALLFLLGYQNNCYYCCCSVAVVLKIQKIIDTKITTYDVK